MKYFSLITASFLAGASLVADPVWAPTESETNLLVAKAVLGVQQREVKGLSSSLTLGSGLSLASCELDLKEPFQEENPLAVLLGVVAEKQLAGTLLCSLWMNDKSLHEVRWDLSAAETAPWGSEGGAKGVTVLGEPAALLFESLAKLYEQNKASKRFGFGEVSLPQEDKQYDVTEYFFTNAPRDAEDKPTGPNILNCSREYFYEKGATRPEKPSKQSCDFIL